MHCTTPEGVIHLMAHSSQLHVGQGLPVVTSALYLISARSFDGSGKVCGGKCGAGFLLLHREIIRGGKGLGMQLWGWVGREEKKQRRGERHPGRLVLLQGSEEVRE